jgi:hypothetical protein
VRKQWDNRERTRIDGRWGFLWGRKVEMVVEIVVKMVVER